MRSALHPSRRAVFVADDHRVDHDAVIARQEQTQLRRGDGSLVLRPPVKPAHLRPQAEADLVEAARHHAKEGSIELAERMFDEALAALERIERVPAMGSPRLGQLCEIPGLRSGRVKGFPMQWLYFEADDHLDVVRLVGDRQDILAILSADE